MLEKLTSSAREEDSKSDEIDKDFEVNKQKIQDFTFTLSTQYLLNQTEEEVKTVVDNLIMKFSLPPTITMYH